MSVATVGLNPNMPWRRTIGLYVNEARFECLRVLRNAEFAVPVIALPLALYLLMGVAMADMRNEPGAHAISDAGVFLSFATFAALYPGMAIIGIQFATELSQGMLAFKRALPMPPASYIGAKIFMALIFGVIVIGLLIALATTLGGVQIPAGRLLLVVAVMAGGIAPGCAMGLFIGTAFPPAAANAVANATFIAMINLAGLFFPLPPFLNSIKSIWPAYHLRELGLIAASASAQSDAPAHVFVLVAVTAVFSALAAWRFSRLS
jgi:ABC-2 type transport system permease protein